MKAQILPVRMKNSVLIMLMAASLAGCADDVNEADAPQAVGQPDISLRGEWIMSTLDLDFVSAPVLTVHPGFRDQPWFTVRPDTVRLVINATLDTPTPYGVDVRYIPPNCSGSGSNCPDWAHTAPESQMVLEKPVAGEWWIAIRGDAGASAGSIHLDIGQLQRADTEEGADEPDEPEEPAPCDPHC